ncbi:hypothetical protein JNJ66_05915 [Candidatus Saccharibacteria bacterium]|nr:hypothetical protein [Candidatus Saccharibacteria bacterium]
MKTHAKPRPGISPVILTVILLSAAVLAYAAFTVAPRGPTTKREAEDAAGKNSTVEVVNDEEASGEKALKF